MKTSLRLALTTGLVTLLTCGAHASLQDGLIAHYAFEGDWSDSSPSGNDGTAKGATFQFDSAPVLGGSRCAGFDGNDLITLAQPLDIIGHDYTLAFWIKDPNTSHAYVIHSWSSVAQPYTEQESLIIGSYNSPNGVYFYQSGWGTGPMTGTRDNSWHHIVYTRTNSDGMVRGYVDGVERTSFVPGRPQTVPEITNFGGPVNNYNPNAYWTGLMDEFRLYDRVLDLHEIDILAGNAPLPPTVPEPATMLAGLAGLAGIGRYLRRRK